MSKNTTVTLSIRIKGSAAADLSRMGRDQVQVAQKVNQTWSMTAKAQGDFVNMTRRATQETKQTAVAGDHLLRTNRMLEGVLRQQAIQTRLLGQQLRIQTSDYQRQTRMLSEQARHARDLQRSMAGAAQSQRSMGQSGTGTAGLVQGAAGVVGGMYAGGAIISTALSEPRGYMESISRSTATATAGRHLSPEQHQTKMLETERWVRNASLKGGATAQGMAAAFDKLVADNAFDYDELEKALLDVSESAFASGSDPVAMAALMGAQRNLGLKDTRLATDQAVAAGELGSFELKHLSTHAPQVLSAGKTAGYRGEEGYKELLVLLQTSKMVTGTPESAAINTENLLNEFASRHFRLAAGKYLKGEHGDTFKKIGLRGNRYGLDITNYLAEKQRSGVQPIEAMAQRFELQFEKNPQFVRYRDEYRAALKNDDKKANPAQLDRMQSMVDLVAQSEIGNIFANKQSLSAFMGYMAQRGEGGRVNELRTAIDTAGGAVTTLAGKHSRQEWAKDGTFDDAKFFTKVDAYNNVAGTLADTKQQITDWAAANKELAANATLAGYALLAVAAGGGLAAFAMGKNGLSGGGGLSKAGGLGAALGAGYIGGTILRDWYTTTETGQDFDNWGGEKIAQLFSMFGVDSAQQALETNKRFDEMIRLQEQQLEAARLANIQRDQQQNKNTPKPVAPYSPRSLMLGLSDAVNQEAQRGAPMWRP